MVDADDDFDDDASVTYTEDEYKEVWDKVF
jgi:hypothetical protein